MKPGPKPGKTNHAQRQSFLKWLVLFLFLLMASLTAYTAYSVSADLTAEWDITGMEGVAANREPSPPAIPGTASTPASTPLGLDEGSDSPPRPTPETILPTPDPWDGASRVNILVLGLDYGDWESSDREGPPRSDTMILLTIDPVTMTAGAISIPRDLWVTMPGIDGYHKINTAHRFGEIYKMPGGGPGLAMRTVEALLGVPIHYYARIDFYAFEDFIDEIGGVEVDVPEEIKVDPIGEHNTVVLDPGVQLLDGPVALAYARNRYTEGGDFDRSERQMQVIMAIRDRVLNLNMLPTLVARAPAIYKQLQEGIHTNLTLEQAIQLAWLAQQIDEDDITLRVIGNKQVIYATAPDGQAIFKPVHTRIRLLRDEVFTASVSRSGANRDLGELVTEEKARLAIINNSGRPDLAEETAAYFEDRGMTVVEVSQGQEPTYGTRILSYTGKPYTLSYLMELMNIEPSQIRAEFEPESEIDVVVYLGTEWDPETVQ